MQLHARMWLCVGGSLRRTMTDRVGFDRSQAEGNMKPWQTFFEGWKYSSELRGGISSVDARTEVHSGVTGFVTERLIVVLPVTSPNWKWVSTTRAKSSFICALFDSSSSIVFSIVAIKFFFRSLVIFACILLRSRLQQH